jgi:hypothetical protein
MLRGDKSPLAPLFKSWKPTHGAVPSRVAEPKSVTPPPPGNKANEEVLKSLDADLLTLLNMTGGVLLRAQRAPARSIGLPGRAAAGNASSVVSAALSNKEGAAAPATGGGVAPAFGPFPMGLELAESIEQRARGLLLENSLTHEQSERLIRVNQSIQDLYCALRASRYTWQVCLLLGPLDGGMGSFARLKRITECVVEMNNRVAQALENQENAASGIAEQYRTFKTTFVQNETMLRNADMSPVARRLTFAALHSLTICADSMAKVGARFTLPISETVRHANTPGRAQVDYDPLLAPVPKR